MIAKKLLNIKIKENASLHNQLEREVKEGLSNLDKDSINQDEDTKTFLHDDQYYRDMAFNENINDAEKIKIGLVLTHSRDYETWDIWNYYRSHISGMKMTKSVGIQLYFLIKDETSNKYLGVMSLGSDFGNLAERDKFIEWSTETRIKNLKYILNIRTCVPLYPFGFNYAGGKLIAMLAFSREVSDIFIDRMKSRKVNPLEYPLLGITTTSLYGKGVQYKDLDEMEYLGLTKGESSLHIPDALYEKCKELCELKNIKFGNSPHSRGKTTVIKALLPSLKLSRDVLTQNNKRGIYFGYLYPNSKELLLNHELTDKIAMDSVNTSQLKTAQEIFQIWLNTYGRKRYTSMASKKLLKKKVSVNASVEELNREKVSNARKEKIVQIGTENLPEGMKPTEYNIRRIGLEVVRKEERDRKNASKSAYKKKTFNDKYSIDKFPDIVFDQRNEHLKEYVPWIIEMVNEDQYITIDQIAKKLSTIYNSVISYDSVRSLLDHIKSG